MGIAKVAQALTNGTAWGSVKETFNKAAQGDQKALEEVSAIFISILIPAKKIFLPNKIGNKAKGIATQKPNVVKGTATVKTPEGISFNINQPKHLATVDGFSQKNGISGGHNANSFYDAAKQNNVKILSETPTGTFGITKVEYQIPTKDRAGNFTGNYKGNGSAPFTKTVYDPKIYTDQKMLDLGQQAVAKSYGAAMASNSSN